MNPLSTFGLVFVAWENHRLGLLLLVAPATLVAMEFQPDLPFDPIATPVAQTSPLNDLRFGYSALPDRADIQIQAQGDPTHPGNYDRDMHWDGTGRFSLTWITPWNTIRSDRGFILGLELSTNHLRVDEDRDAPEIDLRTIQLSVLPGYAAIPVATFHVELMPFIGLGHALIEQSEAGDGTGLYWEVGARGGMYYTHATGWQVGILIGYIFAQTRGEAKGAGATFDADLDFEGLTYGLQIGYRL